MTLAVYLVLALLVAGMFTAWCVWTATRLDRLHLRCEATEAAVRVHLLRRSSLALELAITPLSDPAAARALLAAAAVARDAQGEDTWSAESKLSQTLRDVALPDPADEPLVAMLADVQRRLSLARRIHNGTVASAVALRGRRRARWFRLAGNAPTPVMIEFDDGMA